MLCVAGPRARVAGMVLMGVAAECTGIVQIPPEPLFNPGIAQLYDFPPSAAYGSAVGLWEMSECWRPGGTSAAGRSRVADVLPAAAAPSFRRHGSV